MYSCFTPAMDTYFDLVLGYMGTGRMCRFGLMLTHRRPPLGSPALALAPFYKFNVRTLF